MPTTVLIASPEHLSALHKGDLRDALAFAGNDTLAALDVIKNQCPSLIALEDLYAVTSRGRALIARIEADPLLRGCQIRIVTHVAEPPALEPIDRRRAPRFLVADGVEVRFDGHRALLVNVSLGGAQVISARAFRPNQRGKVTLNNANNAMRMACGVAWAALEFVGGTPQYRAGMEFSDPDTAALQAFIETAKKEEGATAIGAVIISA
jgi:hypothetical protein